MRLLRCIAVVFALVAGLLAVPAPRHVEAQDLDDAVAQVVGGRDAGDHEFPYLVAIFFDGFHRCGGALIAPEWVVSAAHCFVDESVESVVLGLGSANLHDGLQLVAVEEIVLHPDFDSERTTGTNDIALVRLASPVDLSDPTIGLIAVPGSEHPPVGEQGVLLVAGWGDVDPSAEFESTVIARVAKVEAKSCGPFGDDARRVCTSDRDGDGACSGDSGGPLIEVAGKAHTVIAVVEATTNPTEADPLCGTGTTVIHQRIGPHVEWMRSVTGDRFRTCGGRALTAEVLVGVPFVGTDADDVVFGTDAADEIDGAGGDDAICAAAGDDRIRGGPGKDFIDGGAGRDVIHGDAGNDELIGGIDIDRIWGNAGHDILHGDGGSDRLRGGDGNDTVHAGSGADRVWGGPGDDVLFGMGGQDTMWGDHGNDLLQGNHQSDSLYGGPGDDLVYAAGGKDKLFGDEGNDGLFGGPNTDYLDGGDGEDITHGGVGRDNPVVTNVSGCMGETRISC